MTENAGERLFEAIGQISDEWVLEAAKGQVDSRDAAVQMEQGEAARQGTDAKTDAAQKQPGNKKPAMARLGGCLKYLPVVACLCIVFGSAFYIMNNFIDVKNARDASMNDSSSAGGMADGGASDKKEAEQEMAVAEGYDAGEDGAEATEETAPQLSGGAAQMPLLPVRYDAYEGPSFPLTATGDTQKLKVSRSLKGEVTTEGAQPLLHVTDTYRIKNASNEDKTLQLVYPFVATLNRAYDMDGEVLQVQGEGQAPVTYSIGEGIGAYRNAGLAESASMEDYRQIFDGRTDYQEQALKKEVDWNREVCVYTFSDIRVQEGADAKSQMGVVGITVNGAKADVLTYGFDHSFEKESGITGHCFFIPQEEKKLLLIVTGEQEGEPELGYYSNLDCEEEMDGIQCEMAKQEMPYADALRLCSNDAVRKLRQDYGQGIYDATLPEYMDADAAFGALTMGNEEDAFYGALAQRYHSTELQEIFERLFGETRVVYALATVTVPAGQSVRAVAQTQKRQNDGKYMLPEGREAVGQSYQYDFLPSTQSHLRIDKTDFRLTLADGWQLAGDDMGLEQKRASVWKAWLRGGSCYFAVSSRTR